MEMPLTWKEQHGGGRRKVKSLFPDMFSLRCPLATQMEMSMICVCIYQPVVNGRSGLEIQTQEPSTYGWYLKP